MEQKSIGEIKSFMSHEDVRFLEHLLYVCAGDSERHLFNEESWRLYPDYCVYLLKRRKKCFEWMGEEDPNQKLMDEISRKIEEIKSLRDVESRKNKEQAPTSR